MPEPWGSGDFEATWRALAPIGRHGDDGWFRQPYASAELELREWFAEEAAARGLRLEADGNGNLLAWWEVGTGPAVLLGSHLDSVLAGGAYDGPLGVVSALMALDRLREQGLTPSRPVAVACFAEEEGSRFGLACLGSRLAVGAVAPTRAEQLADRDGVRLLDAMAAAGVEPALGPAPWVERVGCFVELHVEQGKGLLDRDAPVGAASGIWPHGRYRYDFLGTADHAGSTAMADRHDPMLTYAVTALAADQQARESGQRATFGRVEAFPNSTNAIASRVSAWLDARAGTVEELTAVTGEIRRAAQERAARDGTRVEVAVESDSDLVAFDADLTARVAPGLPVLPSLAGHDAGVLAGAGVPTAMLFVRNPTGVSHAPVEHAPTADCLAGIEVLTAAVADLTDARTGARTGDGAARG